MSQYFFHNITLTRIFRSTFIEPSIRNSLTSTGLETLTHTKNLNTKNQTRTHHYHGMFQNSKRFNITNTTGGTFVTCTHINKSNKLKGKVHPITSHEGTQGEQRYSSTFSLILAPDGGGQLTSWSGHFTHGNDRVPTVQEVRWAPQPVWTGAENLTSPGFDPRTIQSAAWHYTNYSILAHQVK